MKNLICRVVACLNAVGLIAGFAINTVAQQTTLQFPKKPGCGFVTVWRSGEIPEGLKRIGWSDRVLAPATGDVSIPEGQGVLLDLRGDKEVYRKAICAVPQNGVIGLRIKGGVLDHQTMESICNISSLELLQLEGCQFTDDAFDDLTGVGNLVEAIFSSTISDDLLPKLARWMRRCPNLESLSCRPELTLPAWRELAGHPKLSIVNVSIGQDSIEVLQQVSELKSLQVLSLRVTSQANRNFCKSLEGLSMVRWINWMSGRCGAKELESLSRMENLTKLILQSNPELPEDFLEGLPKLQRLPRLHFYTSREKAEFDQSNLVPALAGMPNLVQWPPLRELSQDDFTLMAQRKNITYVNILSDISEDIDREKLKTMLGNQDLESLFVPRREMFDSLDFLKGQNRLEHLRISAGGLRGSQLSPLGSLQSLKNLEINVEYADQLSFAPLADCPQLESLTISGELMGAIDLEELHRSRSLRRLSIQSGPIDDSAADWLCRGESIVDISLGRDCVLTSAGIKKLASKKSIETLDVGGFLSLQDVEILSTLPNLRRLTIRSPMLSEADQSKLESILPNAGSIYLYPFNLLRGPSEKGTHGFLQRSDDELRKVRDALEGKPAPELRGELVSSTGEAIDLKNLHGKVVLVDFWGTWCGPCRSMMPLLSKLQEKYGDQGLVTIGIHSQLASETLEGYLRTHPKSWPQIIDANDEFAKSYQVKSYPTLFLIDRTGKLRVVQPHVVGLEAAIAELLAQ